MQCLLHEEKKQLVSCMHCDMKCHKSISSHCNFVVVKMKQQKKKKRRGCRAGAGIEENYGK